MQDNFYIENIYSKFIEISGDDKSEFLQGLITNDIFKCNAKNSIYSCILTPQGKFIADFFVSFLEDKYLIEIHEKYYDTFIQKIKMYKLRSKILLNVNIAIKSIILFDSKKIKINKLIINFKDPRSDNIGVKIYINEDHELYSQIINNYAKLNYEKYKEILMINLIPHTPSDLIENKSLLLENNFENINSIDWKKGCYVGQEITARMKYRALLKKKLYIMKIKSGNIKIGESVFDDNKNVGEVISLANKYISCMLKINLIKKKYEGKDFLKTRSSALIYFL